MALDDYTVEMGTIMIRRLIRKGVLIRMDDNVWVIDEVVFNKLFRERLQ